MQLFVAGFVFFVIFFSLAMCTLCKSSQEDTKKRKFYEALMGTMSSKNRKRFETFLQWYEKSNNYSFLLFIVGIVLGSFQVIHKYFYGNVDVYIKGKMIKMDLNFMGTLSNKQKFYLYSLYIRQIGSYLCIFFKRPEASISYMDESVLRLPGRKHYCKTCGVDSLKFDHHCAWIRRCVAAGNHFFFVVFLVETVVIQFSHAIYSALYLYVVIAELQFKGYKNIGNIVFNNFSPIIGQIFIFVAIGTALLPFTILQVRSLLTNQTTFERLKLQKLYREVKNGQKILVKREGQIIPVTESESNDLVISKSESLRFLRNRNIYTRGIIGNIRESIWCAMHTGQEQKKG